MAAACGTQEPASILTTASPATDTAPPATTVPVTTVAVAIDPGLPAAPWSVPPLPAEAAPSVLREAWEAAGNKGFCAALYPADANDLAADAVVRTADFSEDAWAVAWDRPAGPGRDAGGLYCDDCGRSAFGVAGTGGLSPTESVAVWNTRIEWSDGSAAGYGIEGLALPGSGAPHLAFMAVAGQGCTYDVWSFLGEDHLLQLIDELRFVEGMLAAVIDETPDLAVVALGGPPWLRAGVGDAAVPQPLLDEWIEEVLNPETCPLVTPVSLGAGAEGAEARRANNGGSCWRRGTSRPGPAATAQATTAPTAGEVPSASGPCGATWAPPWGSSATRSPPPGTTAACCA